MKRFLICLALLVAMFATPAHANFRIVSHGARDVTVSNGHQSMDLGEGDNLALDTDGTSLVATWTCGGTTWTVTTPQKNGETPEHHWARHDRYVSMGQQAHPPS